MACRFSRNFYISVDENVRVPARRFFIIAAAPPRGGPFFTREASGEETPRGPRPVGRRPGAARAVVLRPLRSPRRGAPRALGAPRPQLPPLVPQPEQLVEPSIRERLRACRAQPLHLGVRRRVSLP